MHCGPGAMIRMRFLRPDICSGTVTRVPRERIAGIVYEGMTYTGGTSQRPFLTGSSEPIGCRDRPGGDPLGFSCDPPSAQEYITAKERHLCPDGCGHSCRWGWQDTFSPSLAPQSLCSSS